MDHRRVLVVDDDEAVARAFGRVLGSFGYETRRACNGLVALKMLAESSFDAMVCDLFMPEREGLETIREVRALYPGMGIVVASGGFGTSEVSLWLKVALALGAVVALAKPVSGDELARAVEAAIARPKVGAKVETG